MLKTAPLWRHSKGKALCQQARALAELHVLAMRDATGHNEPAQAGDSNRQQFRVSAKWPVIVLDRHFGGINSRRVVPELPPNNTWTCVKSLLARSLGTRDLRPTAAETLSL